MTDPYVPEYDLDHYVDRLRAPFREPHIQWTDDGMKIAYTHHDGLLKQLSDAVVGGTGAHAGGGTTLGSERLPFDQGAAALHADACGTIASLYFGAIGEWPERGITAEEALGAWHWAHTFAQYRGKLTPGASEGARLRLKSLSERITAMFEPVHVIELMSACPRCGETHAFMPDTGDRVRSLVVEYHDTGTGAIEGAAARCRFCTRSWTGTEGITLLVALIAKQEAKTHAQDA